MTGDVTQNSVFSIGCLMPDHTFTIGCSVVENVDCVRDLGVMLIQGLNFSVHIAKVV